MNIENNNDYRMRSDEVHTEVPAGAYTGIASGWIMRLIYNGVEYVWESVTYGIRGTMKTTITVDKEGHASCYT